MKQAWTVPWSLSSSSSSDVTTTDESDYYSLFMRSVQSGGLYTGIFCQESMLTLLRVLETAAYDCLAEIYQLVRSKGVSTNEPTMRAAFGTIQTWNIETQEEETDKVSMRHRNDLDVARLYKICAYIYVRESFKHAGLARTDHLSVRIPAFREFYSCFLRHLASDPYVHSGEYFSPNKLLERKLLHMDAIRAAFSDCVRRNVVLRSQNGNVQSTASNVALLPPPSSPSPPPPPPPPAVVVVAKKPITTPDRRSPSRFMRKDYEVVPEDSVSNQTTPRVSTNQIPPKPQQQPQQRPQPRPRPPPPPALPSKEEEITSSSPFMQALTRELDHIRSTDSLKKSILPTTTTRTVAPLPVLQSSVSFSSIPIAKPTPRPTVQSVVAPIRPMQTKPPSPVPTFQSPPQQQPQQSPVVAPPPPPSTMPHRSVSMTPLRSIPSTNRHTPFVPLPPPPPLLHESPVQQSVLPPPPPQPPQQPPPSLAVTQPSIVHSEPVPIHLPSTFIVSPTTVVPAEESIISSEPHVSSIVSDKDVKVVKIHSVPQMKPLPRRRFLQPERTLREWSSDEEEEERVTNDNDDNNDDEDEDASRRKKTTTMIQSFKKTKLKPKPKSKPKPKPKSKPVATTAITNDKDVRKKQKRRTPSITPSFVPVYLPMPPSFPPPALPSTTLSSVATPMYYAPTPMFVPPPPPSSQPQSQSRIQNDKQENNDTYSNASSSSSSAASSSPPIEFPPSYDDDDENEDEEVSEKENQDDSPLLLSPMPHVGMPSNETLALFQPPSFDSDDSNDDKDLQETEEEKEEEEEEDDYENDDDDDEKESYTLLPTTPSSSSHLSLASMTSSNSGRLSNASHNLFYAFPSSHLLPRASTGSMTGRF